MTTPSRPCDLHQYLCPSARLPASRRRVSRDHVMTNLLAVNTPVVCLQHHEPLASHVQPCALDLLHAIGAFVFICRHHFLHLLRRDGKPCGACPYRVALGIEDGGLVDITGADKAVLN